MYGSWLWREGRWQTGQYALYKYWGIQEFLANYSGITSKAPDEKPREQSNNAFSNLQPTDHAQSQPRLAETEPLTLTAAFSDGGGCSGGCFISFSGEREREGEKEREGDAVPHWLGTYWVLRI